MDQKGHGVLCVRSGRGALAWLGYYLAACVSFVGSLLSRNYGAFHGRASLCARVAPFGEGWGGAWRHILVCP